MSTKKDIDHPFLKGLPLSFLMLVVFAPVVIPHAYANAAFPTLVMLSPFMALLFFPVIALEAIIYMRLFGISEKKIYRHVFFANLLSTFLGYPVFYLLSFFLLDNTNVFPLPYFVFLSDSVQTYSQFFWQNIPLLFFLSIIIEFVYLRWGFAKKDQKHLLPAVTVSHLVSYFLLSAVVYLVFS